jgi:hypothetical protein
VLIDDSIGSGDRMAGFVKSMMAHKTFKSWWSLGLIKLIVVSLARTKESEGVIFAALPGEERRKRKFSKSSKLEFVSETVYSKYELNHRWGDDYSAILSLCDSQTAVPKDRRRGYGEIMANIVFYHSVPNNTPGVIWCKSSGWKPLFSRRAVPNWFSSLIEKPASRSRVTRSVASLPGDMLEILTLVKNGIRRISSLAARSDLDPSSVRSIVDYLLRAGLVSENTRLTEAGIAALKHHNSTISSAHTMDHSLYVPSSWCSDQASSTSRFSNAHPRIRQPLLSTATEASGDARRSIAAHGGYSNLI